MKANTSTKIRLIASALDLCNFAACVNAGDDCAPIGDGTNKFNGTFDGDGHIIHNLRIESFGFWSEVSLFRDVGEGGTIKNLNLPNVKISGNETVGGLVGYNYGAIQKCVTSGTVSGDDNVGGFVGLNDDTIQVCSTAGAVTGKKYVGGLVGNNFGTIYNCTASGSVCGDELVCGFVGFNSGTIQDCTASGTVSGKKYFCGLAILNGGTVENCTANVTRQKSGD